MLLPSSLGFHNLTPAVSCLGCLLQPSWQVEAAYDLIFSSQLRARLTGDLPVSSNVRCLPASTMLLLPRTMLVAAILLAQLLFAVHTATASVAADCYG